MFNCLFLSSAVRYKYRTAVVLGYTVVFDMFFHWSVGTFHTWYLISGKSLGKFYRTLKKCYSANRPAQFASFPASALSFPRCWRKANILPDVVQADLDQDLSETTAKHNESLHELAVLVQRLSLGAVGKTPDDDICDALYGLGLVPGAYPSQASIDAAEAWIGVEEKKHVAFAVVEDLKDDICLELFAPLAVDLDDDDTTPAGVQGGASSAGGKDRSTKPGAVLPRPPRYANVADDFGKLEEVAERCRMPTVSYYLRKAKLAWMTEVGSRE